MKVFERVYGKNHYELAVTFNNLGAIAQARGKLARAERYYRRALRLKETLLGRTHSDTAMTLHNLALCLEDQQKPRLALTLLRRALKIFERTCGRRHPNTRTCREHEASLSAACTRTESGL